MEEAERLALRKEAVGLLDPLIYAPFSALAGLISGPPGERGRSSALGAVIGAGMAALGQKEVEERAARGEAGGLDMLMPGFRAIASGIAAGGVLRAAKERREEGEISTTSAILAGVPTGALLLSESPIVGMLLGGVTAPYLASLLKRDTMEAPPEIRARAAVLATRARLEAARREMVARRVAATAAQLRRHQKAS